MFVLSKRNIVIPAPDGSAAVRLRAGMMERLCPAGRLGRTISGPLSEMEKLCPPALPTGRDRKRRRKGKDPTGRGDHRGIGGGSHVLLGPAAILRCAGRGGQSGQQRGELHGRAIPGGFPAVLYRVGESLLPRTMLDEFIRQANAAIQPDKWLDGWRYAAGLYTAHYATLYLKTYAPSSETPGRPRPPGRWWGWWPRPSWGRTASLMTQTPSRKRRRTGAT